MKISLSPLEGLLDGPETSPAGFADTTPITAFVKRGKDSSLADNGAGNSPSAAAAQTRINLSPSYIYGCTTTLKHGCGKMGEIGTNVRHA